MELRHLLIIGAPHSGTTLLSAMISRHTEVGILNEDKRWTMRRLLGKAIVGNKRCIPNQLEIKKRHWFEIRLWKRLGLAKEYPTSRYSIEEYMSLPRIQVIALLRNGDDVILSGIRRGKIGFSRVAYRWRRANQIIQEVKSRYPDQVLIVSFEDLVLHPRENMERVARFLKIDYQERMLEGPLYNPWYHESGMNQEKVNRSKREQLDFKLAERFPEAVLQYQQLLQLCQTVEEFESRASCAS